MSDATCSIEGCAKRVNCRGLCSTHYHRWRKHGDPHQGPGTPYGAPMAFIEQAVASSTDQCIIWPYARTGSGYGKVNVRGTLHNAHRLVLERAVGTPPCPGMAAAHAPLVCHNRLCVNPRHLRWATTAENHADKVPDGTHHRGERQGASKLTTAQVLAIRTDRRPIDAISKDYGISARYVYEIRAGRTWTWLEPDHA